MSEKGVMSVDCALIVKSVSIDVNLSLYVVRPTVCMLKNLYVCSTACMFSLSPQKQTELPSINFSTLVTRQSLLFPRLSCQRLLASFCTPKS